MSNKAKFEEALAKLPEEYKGFEDSLRQLFDVADQKMPEAENVSVTVRVLKRRQITAEERVLVNHPL